MSPASCRLTFLPARRRSAAVTRQSTPPSPAARSASADRRNRPLELAAEDDHEAFAEGFDRPPRRLDVGRLRVVHELDVPIRITGSSACSRPENTSTAAVIAAGLTPARCATAAAAITSVRRCRPSSRTDVSGTSRTDSPLVRRTMLPLSMQMPSASPSHRHQQALRSKRFARSRAMPDRRRSARPSPTRSGSRKYGPSRRHTPRRSRGDRGDPARS